MAWPRSSPSEVWASNNPAPLQTDSRPRNRLSDRRAIRRPADVMGPRSSGGSGFLAVGAIIRGLMTGHADAAAFKIWLRSAARSLAEREGDGRCWQSWTVRSEEH